MVGTKICDVAVCEIGGYQDMCRSSVQMVGTMICDVAVCEHGGY
jgi:hypothetical protein